MIMNDKHDVEYIFTDGVGSDTHIKAKMEQKELGKLLLRDDVILLNVNKEKTVYRKKNTCTRKRNRKI